MNNENNYLKLKSINVNDCKEKRGKFDYLSWSDAVDYLLSEDGSATWEYGEVKYYGDTAMVFCSVTAFGKKMTSQLAVMDHTNKAIAKPNAVDINKAMQRCLVKAIALHGIGLYIYQGEDLPDQDMHNQKPEDIDPSTMQCILTTLDMAISYEHVKQVYLENKKYTKFEPTLLAACKKAKERIEKEQSNMEQS